MPLTITTLQTLNEYINGVILRADHHGKDVNEIVLALAGAVVWKATKDVEVRKYDDQMANILWLTIDDRRYALAFNHQTGDIELRDRTINGFVKAKFNNATPISKVKETFSKL